MKTSSAHETLAEVGFLTIIFLPEEWHEYTRRPHWLAVADMGTMLALEPPVGILTAWLHPKRLVKYIFEGRRIRRGEGNIFFYRPISLVSYGVGYRFSWLAYVDRFLLLAQLKRVVRSLRKKFNHLISFVVKLQQYYVMDILPAVLRCYEVTDEYCVTLNQDKFDLCRPLTRRARQIEQRILSQADIVFASSPELYNSRRKINPSTYYIPNCADYDHFSKAVRPGLEIPSDLRMVPGPRIGYVGYINETIDMDLINILAKARPNWSIVLIGNENGSKDFMQSPAYRESKSQANIYYLGFLDYELLPACMKGIDVCLLPFGSGEWNKNRFPNKIYQYLAAGKPIVSTDFPAVWSAKEVINIARERKDFLRLVEKALLKNNQELVKKRMKVARQNSTHVRARKKLDIIRERLKERK